MVRIFQTKKTLSSEGKPDKGKVGRLYIPTILDLINNDTKYSVGLKNTKDEIVLVPTTLSDYNLSDCCEVDIKKVRDRRLSISTSIMEQFNYSKGEEIILTVFDNGVMEVSKIK